MFFWPFLEGLLLLANALAILNEDRFLAPRGWSMSEVSGNGQSKSLKGQIVGLIYATQFFRMPLIALNILIIVVKLEELTGNDLSLVRPRLSVGFEDAPAEQGLVRRLEVGALAQVQRHAEVDVPDHVRPAHVKEHDVPHGVSGSYSTASDHEA
uniref:Yos1-like protein n=1 Tax=Oryza meridionalis TaxID=40149 RepID=A0A0E0D001_9ORYZ